MWLNADRIDIPGMFVAIRGERSGDLCPSGNGFKCTRASNHLGRHIATGSHRVYAAWPGDQRPTLTDLEGDPE